MSEDQLRARAAEIGFSSDEGVWAKIAELKRLWGLYGRSMNLTGSLDDLAVNSQILESFQVVVLAQRAVLGGRWLDIGSGGGFPALVVAACLEVEMTCVEPRAKRAGFLELALRKIGARGKVLRGRVEGGEWKGIDGAPRPEPADVCSARAVFEPRAWVAEGRRWIVPGGVVVVHLGVGDVDVEGELMGRVDGDRWSVRGYRFT